MAQTRTDDDTEEKRERYRELLEEFRTIIPGVQVLFGFLLTTPFSSRFTELDATGRALFVTALGTSALSIITFLTPASYHRVTKRSLRTDRLRVAIWMALSGMLLLGLAMVTAVIVVTRLIYNTTVGASIGGGLAAAAVALWYLLPLARRSLGIAVEEDEPR